MVFIMCKLSYMYMSSQDKFLCLQLGMSFGIRFRVRTFGNKHPDGSKVRIFFFLSDQIILIICAFMYEYIHT